MVKNSLRKVMIMLMVLTILAKFKSQANVHTSGSLSPTSLPIRLLQSSQPDNDHKHHCYESTYEKCKHFLRPTKMVPCVTDFLIF
jgi:hypothetical protein